VAIPRKETVVPDDSLIQRAHLLAELGRHDEAEALFARVLAEDPDNEDALATLARGLVARHRFAEADELTGRLLAAHPESLRGLIGLARIRLLRDRPWEGVVFARRALAAHPNAPTALTTLADLLSTVTPGSAEALDLVERAIALEPDNAYPHLLAGRIHLGVAHYGEAERRILESLRIDPDDGSAVLQLGLARAGLGRFAKSRAEVLAALRANPSSAHVRQVIEYIETRAIPPHLADIYRMALAANDLPDLSEPGAAGHDPDLLAAQGRLAWRMYALHADPAGRRRAGRLANAVLTAEPDNQDARYVRTRTLGDAGRHAEALPLAERLWEDGYPGADDALLAAYSGLGRYEEALAATRRALEDSPESGMYLRIEAECLRALDRPEEALQSARRAAELSPWAPQVQLQLGLSARAVGDAVLAERALRAAVEQDAAEPDGGDLEPVAYLALLLAELDRWAEAEELMPRLRRGIADPGAIGVPCAELAGECLGQAVPPLRRIDDADPDPALLAEAARWIDRALDMYEAVACAHATGPEVLAENLTGIQTALHSLTAPPGSGYARMLRRLDAFVADPIGTARADRA
jgi:tetratricopeptide (TPR) repeat protein